MKTKEVPIAWIRRAGLRLDAGPFLGGALEAQILIEEARFKKQQLSALTRGFKGGLFTHQFSPKRTYVEDARYGTPMLGASSMMLADLSSLPLMSNRDVNSRSYRNLIVRQGMTLASSSGIVGRLVYARADMDGMISTGDTLKIQPDPKLIRPGYLYAFLSSKFGLPLVTLGTYGSIIQHLEPSHIAGLPVPRLGDPIERKAHEFVERAAWLRVKAAKSLQTVAQTFDNCIESLDTSSSSPRINAVLARNLQTRMDAQFHDPVAERIRSKLRASNHTTIGEWCQTIFLPGIFKRLYTEDPSHGVPYYTGQALYCLEPIAKGLLSRRTALFDDVSLQYGTVLVQAFGQEGGLTGKPVWVGRNLAGAATTHMLVRLKCNDLESSAYLFGFLQSQAAYRQISVLPFGGSIPHFNEANIATVVMPTLDAQTRTSISGSVRQAMEARDEALKVEREARRLVEKGIEEAA